MSKGNSVGPELASPLVVSEEGADIATSATVAEVEADPYAGEALEWDAEGARLCGPDVLAATPRLDKSNILIIVDYDDTLFATHWLAVRHKVALGSPLPAWMAPLVRALERRALQTLRQCAALGQLVVVTNASYEWVNLSAAQWTPRLHRWLAEKGVVVLSARDRLQRTGLAQHLWKRKIFDLACAHLLSTALRSGAPATVVSLGDGESERAACLGLHARLGAPKGWTYKSFKLLAQPTVEQLIRQHIALQRTLNKIVHSATSYDMCVDDYEVEAPRAKTAAPASETDQYIDMITNQLYDNPN